MNKFRVQNGNPYSDSDSDVVFLNGTKLAEGFEGYIIPDTMIPGLLVKELPKRVTFEIEQAHDRSNYFTINKVDGNAITILFVEDLSRDDWFGGSVPRIFRLLLKADLISKLGKAGKKVTMGRNEYYHLTSGNKGYALRYNVPTNADTFANAVEAAHRLQAEFQQLLDSVDRAIAASVKSSTIGS